MQEDHAISGPIYWAPVAGKRPIQNHQPRTKSGPLETCATEHPRPAADEPCRLQPLPAVTRSNAAHGLLLQQAPFGPGMVAGSHEPNAAYLQIKIGWERFLTRSPANRKRPVEGK